MLVYCDSCILMYFYDHSGILNVRAATKLAQIAGAGDLIATSDLVRLECRVKPIQLAEIAKLAAYDTFFSRPDVRRVSIDSRVFDRATEIRARFRFKLGDAIHLAAAVESGCNSFLTNDTRLSRFTEIRVEILS